MKKSILSIAATVALVVLPVVAFASTKTISEEAVQKLSKLYAERASVGRHLEAIDNGELHVFITEDWGFTSLDDVEVINAVRQHLERQAKRLDAEIREVSEDEKSEEGQKGYLPASPGVGT